jgi:hypothetical protein
MRRAILCLTVMLLLTVTSSAETDRVHQPVYSDDLQRQSVLVTFEFVDAADNPVYVSWAGSDIQANLRRIDNDYEWDEPCFVDGDNVVAGTEYAPGLEPGSYRLEVAVGHYGNTSHEFEVRGKELALTVQLPHERRVIRVKYVDGLGETLEWVRYAPRFMAGLARLPRFESQYPEPVLRLPPRSLGGRGGFGHRRASGRGGGPATRLLTDDGVMYIHVFEGAGGTLNVPLGDGLYGVESMTFTEPFAEELLVEVFPTAAYFEMEEVAEVRNEGDPGYKRSYTVPRAAAATPESKFTRETKVEASPTVLAWARDARAIGSSTVPARLVDGVWRWSELDEMTPAVTGTWTSATAGFRGHRLTSGFGRASNQYIFNDRTTPIRLFAEDNEFRGTFLRVLDADGNRVPFAEAVIMPLDQDKVASAMREHEIKLEEDNRRPSENAGISGFRAYISEHAPDEEVKRAIGRAAWDALEKREYRLRFAMFSAWYDSHQRMDGDADGFVIAPHVRLEEGQRYVLYVWGESRHDLRPDLRLVIEGQGPITDLGVIRLR